MTESQRRTAAALVGGLSLLLGCAGAPGREAAAPRRYTPGVARPTAPPPATRAPLHRPSLLATSESQLSGDTTGTMPACPMFDPFDAEERLRRALEPLMAGNDDQGRRELLLALCQEPDDPRARDLLRQLDVDPEQELGREFFAYRVRPGDTLPGIAKRHLDDPYRFYVLARYNHMDQPGEIREGQCLRIPGASAVAPEASAAELAYCGADAERAGDSPLAHAYFLRGAAVDPGNPECRDGATRVAAGAARRYRQNAVRALREQDLQAACWNSDRALEIQPENVEMVTLHDTAEELGQRLANTLYREALAAYERGDRAEALANCSRVLELDPDHPGAGDLLQQVASMAPGGN